MAVTASREGDEIVLEVKDSGIGIDPALLPTVFDMFVQGEQGPERAEGGLGLGLSLVRTLTALHGGTVSATSGGNGRGSELVVRLPVATLPESKSVEPRRLRVGARPRRVLVVDDNHDAVALLAEVLVSADDP